MQNQNDKNCYNNSGFLEKYQKRNIGVGMCFLQIKVFSVYYEEKRKIQLSQSNFVWQYSEYYQVGNIIGEKFKKKIWQL